MPLGFRVTVQRLYKWVDKQPSPYVTLHDGSVASSVIATSTCHDPPWLRRSTASRLPCIGLLPYGELSRRRCGGGYRNAPCVNGRCCERLRLADGVARCGNGFRLFCLRLWCQRYAHQIGS